MERAVLRRSQEFVLFSFLPFGINYPTAYQKLQKLPQYIPYTIRYGVYHNSTGRSHNLDIYPFSSLDSCIHVSRFRNLVPLTISTHLA